MVCREDQNISIYIQLYVQHKSMIINIYNVIIIPILMVEKEKKGIIYTRTLEGKIKIYKIENIGNIDQCHHRYHPIRTL